MHALITGGCGFIGSHLADQLVAEGHRVTILDDLSSGKREQAPPAATLIVGDIASPSILATAMVAADVVFHLAAIPSVQRCEQEPERTHETNVLGTVLLMETAALRGIPVIYASSAAIYGDIAALPLRESLTPAPLSAYGRHKLQNEQHAAALAEKKGLNSVGLRFFNVYGPRQDPHSPYSGVISKFMEAARAGNPLTIFGDGEQTRDFIYVGDVVNLLMAALHAPAGAHRVNGCTGHAVSLQQLATAMGDALHRPLATRHEPARANDIRHSLGDPALAATLLGFRARTALADGLSPLLAAGN